jgi:SAM-dependent methyltransferase
VGAYPDSITPIGRSAAIPETGPEPPPIDQPFEPAQRVDEPPPRPYDLELFEALNAEYASKPVAQASPSYDRRSITDRARRRVLNVHREIDLAGRTVLEVGCGAGYEVWFAANWLGADAWGIDVSPRRAWSDLGGGRVHLVAGDIAGDHGLPASTFERAMSFTVWEHIRHPRAAFLELFRLMRPGGIAWIRANLYRGPTASHRSRHIHFPFPHLLFDDDVVAEGLRRAGAQPLGSAWVNRLTWEQYEALMVETGFTIRALRFDRYPLDESFYRRFEDVLGRYPRRDLERGFFRAIIEKPIG